MALTVNGPGSLRKRSSKITPRTIRRTCSCWPVRSSASCDRRVAYEGHHPEPQRPSVGLIATISRGPWTTLGMVPVAAQATVIRDRAEKIAQLSERQAHSIRSPRRRARAASAEFRDRGNESCIPSARAARIISVMCGFEASCGLTSMAAEAALGIRSRNSSNRLRHIAAVVNTVTPVRLPPGRLRLATRRSDCTSARGIWKPWATAIAENLDEHVSRGGSRSSASRSMSPSLRRTSSTSTSCST